MRPLLVVPPDPTAYFLTCLREALEVVLPDAFLFQAAEEPLNHSVLLRRVGRDVFLFQPIEPARLPEPAALKDQPVIAANDWCLRRWPQSAEAPQASLLQCSLRFLSPASKGELIANYLAVVAINHGCQVAPPVSPTVDVCQVHRPSLVARFSAAPQLANTRLWRNLPLMQHPAFDLHQAVNLLAIDYSPFTIPEQRPHPAIAIGRMLLDKPVNLFDQQLIRLCLRSYLRGDSVKT